MTNRGVFLSRVISAVGAPYLWGGQSQRGYDCSGLIVWALELPDTNSVGLAGMFKEIATDVGREGSLWFYGSRGKISHVMACIRVWPSGQHVLAGARGGDNSTTSERAAAIRGAFVDVVLDHLYQPSKLIKVCDPFL